MLLPRDEILNLIYRGKNLQNQINQKISSEIHSSEIPIIGDFLIKEIVPHGYKKLARNTGKYLKNKAKQDTEKQYQDIAQRFFLECESKIKQMSINTKNLTVSGNSQRLTQKLNRIRKIKNPISFLRTLVIVLEELQNLNIIWNKDISAELAKRKEIIEKEKQEKAKLKVESGNITRLAQTVELFDKISISNSLENYPSVKNSILGALDRLQTNDPDAERHCITSCRAAIESLCITEGKNKYWKESLNNILLSDTDCRQVKGIMHFLSGKGAHGGRNPTKKEAEYCLQLTIATINFIFNRIEKKKKD